MWPQTNTFANAPTGLAALSGVVLAACLTMLGPPSARADSFTLTADNLGIVATVGTISLAQNGANDVQVSITMDPGYSLKIEDGQDVNFNDNVGTIGQANIVLNNVDIGAKVFPTGLATTVKNGQNADGFGSFNVNLTGITCSSCPNGTASVDSLVFDVVGISGLTPSKLEVSNGAPTNAMFSVHFCTASGGNCGPLTGFAAPGGSTSIPEPASMALMGTFLRGAYGLLRRKLREE